MTFPWKRRTEQRRLLAETEARLQKVEQDWVQVRKHAAVLREQKELNHYTGMAAAIFGFGNRGRHSS